MNKVGTIVGILLLASIVALPVMAWGPAGDWHRGRGGGYGPCSYGGAYDEELNRDQARQLDALHDKFLDETEGIRRSLRTKSDQLDEVLDSSDPDMTEAKELQREISALSNSLDEKRLEYMVEARKIAPEVGSYRGRGREYRGYHGRGPGYRHGRGPGYHHGYRGHGPGYCPWWN